ncbi:MAG TPA: hypothetical protein VEY71_02340 [Chitinophagales bacterium]|nr:hypothetical protein [Chitinophagales bacterium]
MKNILSLSAGVLLAISFQACDNAGNDPNAAANDQRRMDSTVTARINFTRDSLMRECNTQVLALASFRADSIIAARTGKPNTTKRPTTTVGTTTTTSTTTTTTTNDGTGKLKDRTTDQTGKLKDRAGVGDTTRKTGGKLKDRTP